MGPDVATPVDHPADAVLDIPHRELVELAARFSHAFRRWVDTGNPDGLTFSRLRLLETLHCQGPAKMKTLADGLNLSARNLTSAADSLEADGLVRRVAHPTDRRATLLELTPTGEAEADESLGPRLAQISGLFDELSPAVRATLRAALATLVAAMESETGPRH
jgi:DNA-binding MarR family transcriptional regulator